MRCAALHVRSEAGGEGGRPSGETHQHSNQPVNWQRSAASFSDRVVSLVVLLCYSCLFCHHQNEQEFLSCKCFSEKRNN